MKIQNWINKKDSRPINNQHIYIKGIPDGMTEEIIVELYYFDKVGFAEQVTYWIPFEEYTFDGADLVSTVAQRDMDNA